MSEKKIKENWEEPISQLNTLVKNNQEFEEELVGKGSIELDDSLIAEEKKANQISFKDSAKEEVCQVHSLTPFMSQLVNVVVGMMDSETSVGRIECVQDDVFQVQDVVTGDQRIILVVETTEDGFMKTNSISPSQILVEMSNWDLWMIQISSSSSNGTLVEVGSSCIVNGNGCVRKIMIRCISLGKQRARIGCDEIKWGKCSASGSSRNNGMSAEIGSSCIINGNVCSRKKKMASIALGKKKDVICSENTRQQVEKCSRRKFTETKLKNDVWSMFVEARNVFCQKYLDASYSREEMEVLRFENSYQQRQIWREVYTGLAPIVAKPFRLLAEARQNHKSITNQLQQHHQHSRQSQQHHQYPQEQQQQQHHQHVKKPLQHHRHHYQLAGVHRENTSNVGASTAIGRMPEQAAMSLMFIRYQYTTP